MPSTPQTTGVAGADVAQFAAQGPAVLDHDHRIHPLALDLDPVPSSRTSSGGWSSSRSRPAHNRPGRPAAAARPAGGQAAAERDQLFEHLQRRLGRRRDSHRNRRRLIVAPADVETQDVERRVALHHRVEDDVQDLRVDQMPFGFDHFAVPNRFRLTSAMSRRSGARAAAGRGVARRFRSARGRGPTRARLERRHERQPVLAERGSCSTPSMLMPYRA